MSLDDCLPADLRGSDTSIVRVAAGLSGAGVYRVDAAGRAYVLKISAADRPLDDWRHTLGILRAASGAGLAPRVVHVDEARRAVVSEFVVDRGFPRFYRDPSTHDESLALLGRTMRRVHALPLPPDARVRDGRAFLAESWPAVADWSLPAWARTIVERMLEETPPADDRAPALSHNDANPSNLAFDGERLLLLDWDTAAVNDPLFDLATLSLFLRMNEGECRLLVAAHDDAAPAELPARFVYDRRLIGAMICTVAAGMVRRSGHAGASGDERLETTMGLAEFYGRMMAGALSLATPDGQWAFALAVLKESLSIA